MTDAGNVMDYIYTLEHGRKCVLYEQDKKIYLINISKGKISPPTILSSNYDRELTAVRVGNEIYYAYINIENDVEIATVVKQEQNVLLSNSSARSHYRNIRLCYRFRELFLLYTCYEPVRNMYMLGAIYPFPGKKEEVISTMGNRNLGYEVITMEEGLFLKIYNGNESKELMKKGPKGFFPGEL